MVTTSATQIADFIFAHHIVPAQSKGERMVMISVREVWKALDGAFPLDHIHGVLGSMKFRNTYRLALVAQEGSTEDLVDTYVFKLHKLHRIARDSDQGATASSPAARPARRAGSKPPPARRSLRGGPSTHAASELASEWLSRLVPIC